MMLIFNLLPIYPLDGFQILKLILSLIYEEEYCNDFLKYVMYFFLVCLMIFSIIFKTYSVLLVLIILFVKYKRDYPQRYLQAIKRKILLTNYFQKK